MTVKCLKAVFISTFLEVMRHVEACALNNLLCYYKKRCFHECQKKTLKLSLANPRKGSVKELV